MLLTYAGSNVFQLYTAIHLSGRRSDGGDTEFRPGLESFSITYDVSLESTLIELPNLFFKQQCPSPDHDVRQLDTSLKSGSLLTSSFHGVHREGDS